VPLAFDGELSFSVDGPGGATSGTVTGDGRVLRVHAADPVAAWDAAVGSVTAGPAALSGVADILHAEGAVIEVSGPDGLVATVGADVDSAVGRLLTGSRHVRLGRPAAVRPLAVAQLKRSAKPLARPAGLLAAALALVWLLVRRARR